MRFLEIELIDFMSFENEALRLDSQGLVFVEGINKDSASCESNGAGKSTLIVEAILWALYGKTARGISGDDIVRDEKPGSTHVRLDFEQSGKHYRVLRYQGHRQQSNKLVFFTLDGKGEREESLTQNDKNRTQQKIEEVVGFGLETLLYSFVIGHHALRFAEATDAVKKGILETTLRLDIFECARQAASQQVGKLDAQLYELNTQVTRLQSSRHSREANLGTLMRKDSEWKETRGQQVAVARRQLQDLLTQKACRLDLPEQMVAIFREIEELQSIRGVVEKGYKIREVLQQRLSACREATGVLRVQCSCEHIPSEVDLVQKGKCPRCAQVLPPPLLQVEKSRLESELRKLGETKTQLEVAQKNEAMWQTYLSVLPLCEQEVVPLYNPRLSELIAHHEAMKNSYNDLKAIDLRLEELQSALRDLSSEASPFVELINEQNIGLQKDIADLAEVEGKQNAILVQRNLYAYWVSGFGRKGIQSFLIDTVTGFLTERANEYARVLCGDDLSIEFKSTTETKAGAVREEFTVTCKNRKGSKCYKGQSGGERHRVDLPVALALQDLLLLKTGLGLNIVVLDEALPNMDQLGVEKVMDLLNYIRDRRETVFVVSHSPYYREYFDTRLTIVKEAGKSSIQ